MSAQTEQWTADGDVVEVVECDQCHHVLPCKRRSNPFMEEIHDVKTPEQWWCYSCYREACDEI